MHFIIALFVIIGLIGAVMLLTDEDSHLFGLSESSNIVKKFKQEEEAFAQFCKGQEERDDAKKVAPVQVIGGNAQNNKATEPTRHPAAAIPASVAGLSFNQHPFGNVDFHHLGEIQPSAPAGQAPAGPVAQTPGANGNMSQAQQMQSSSNPIIKTWAGYVSQIEAAEK
jgi:hypothetical protein